MVKENPVFEKISSPQHASYLDSDSFSFMIKNTVSSPPLYLENTAQN